MSWVSIDDGFAQHPKVVKAGPLAMAMQVAALCYCNRNLTDGFIPRAVAYTLLHWGFDLDEKVYSFDIGCGMHGESATCEFVIKSLISAGMWDPDEDGYWIHDYLSHQPSKQTVMAKREEIRKLRSKAGSKGAATRWQNHGPSPSPSPLPNPNPKLERDPDSDARERAREQQPTTRSGNGESKIACPATLELTPAQRGTLETGMIPGWAIDAIRLRFVGKATADQSDLRTLTAWRKSLASAVAGDWNDPNRRPKQDDSGTEAARERLESGIREERAARREQTGPNNLAALDIDGAMRRLGMKTG